MRFKKDEIKPKSAFNIIKWTLRRVFLSYNKRKSNDLPGHRLPRCQQWIQAIIIAGDGSARKNGVGWR